MTKFLTYMGRTEPAANPLRVNLHWRSAVMDEVLRALKYRAWHRGTREADIMIGGFFDAHNASWDKDQRALFAALLTEQDVDIMAWAIGTQEVPERYQGPMMDAFRRLDFIRKAT